MNDLYLHRMLLAYYIQQYFNSWILLKEAWKLLIAFFQVLNTGALMV